MEKKLWQITLDVKMHINLGRPIFCPKDKTWFLLNWNCLLELFWIVHTFLQKVYMLS